MDFVKAASPILPVKVIPLTDNIEASQSQFIEDSQTFTTPPSQLSQAVQDVPVDGESSLFKEGLSLPDTARQVNIFIVNMHTSVLNNKVQLLKALSHNFPSVTTGGNL